MSSIFLHSECAFMVFYPLENLFYILGKILILLHFKVTSSFLVCKKNSHPVNRMRAYASLYHLFNIHAQCIIRDPDNGGIRLSLLILQILLPVQSATDTILSWSDLHNSLLVLGSHYP